MQIIDTQAVASPTKKINQTKKEVEYLAFLHLTVKLDVSYKIIKGFHEQKASKHLLNSFNYRAK